MRTKLVIGNWKMNGRLAANEQLLHAMLALPAIARAGAGIAAPMAYIPQIARLCADSGIRVCAQDVSHFATDGAYTGEVSAAMLADLGCAYVLVGHSERRQYFAEAGAVLAAKVSATLDAGMMPVFCVGETLDERDAGDYLSVIFSQLEVLRAFAGRELVVAYEPVWAIGTGKVASIEQITEIHAEIKKWLLQSLGGTATIRVLYGGSVKADNAEAIMAVPGVDGALVGGASLDASTFESICQTVEK